MFHTPEVGEILQAVGPRINRILEKGMKEQLDVCMQKGFRLPKYYIWILYFKNEKGQLEFRKPICRVTRPSPYQDEDMLLWSVTNHDCLKFEWGVPKKETISYMLANPHKYHTSTIKMLRDYCNDRLERLDDYVVNGKIA